MDSKALLAAEAAKAAEQFGIKDEPTNAPTEPAATPPEPAEPTAPVDGDPQTPAEPAPEPTPEPAEPEPTAPVPATPGDEEDDDYPDIPTFVPQPQQQQVQPAQQVPQTPAQVPTAPQQPATIQQPELPALNPAQFTDQYGNVDMNKFTDAMRQRDLALVNQVSSNLTNALTGNFQNLQATIMQQARQEATQQIMAAESEKRQWERTFAKYPQVKENKELRDQIHKMRLGEVAVTGKQVSPVKIADRYFSHIAAAREDGVKQATQTVKVQATAHLETADNTASDKGLEAKQNWDRVGDRNRRTAETARQDILKQWMSDGTLKI